jgi:hypothetical protein
VLVVGDAAVASQKPAYEKQAKALRNVAVRSFILALQGTHSKEYHLIAGRMRAEVVKVARGAFRARCTREQRYDESSRRLKR